MRPSSYSDATAERICEEIASGRSLRSVCTDPGMPSRESVRRWIAANPDFRGRYEQAERDRADAFADSIVEIADDQTDDAQSRRVRVDARKWVAARILQGKYGDRIEQAGSVEVVYRIHRGPKPE